MSVALLAFALIAPAQPDTPPLRFKWTANQSHTYKVAQQSTVRETTLDPKTEKPVVAETRTNLTLVKKWVVKAVDDKGVATLELSITEMKIEFRRPDGTSEMVDSANPEQAKAMAAFLNVAFVVVRVDSQGRIVEVKRAMATAGSEARLRAELPFRMTLPDATPAATQTWDRTFTMKLDPPFGTGESYDFTQKYTSNGVKDGLLTATVETTLKAPPKALAERVPLVPMLWTGEVYFNAVAGKYHAARLKVKAELPNYQGEGTKFEYESVYSEDAVEK